mmetsp:Transcript_11140/g.45129  ORF Transcript_11140/g.45129 Transcript_11140/m.45129 type:complete len:218 (-) Transcript_11140:1118-1771(-)
MGLRAARGLLGRRGPRRRTVLFTERVIAAAAVVASQYDQIGLGDRRRAREGPGRADGDVVRALRSVRARPARRDAAAHRRLRLPRGGTRLRARRRRRRRRHAAQTARPRQAGQTRRLGDAVLRARRGRPVLPRRGRLGRRVGAVPKTARARHGRPEVASRLLFGDAAHARGAAVLGPRLRPADVGRPEGALVPARNRDARRRARRSGERGAEEARRL